MSAIVDALSALGRAHIDKPAALEKVWRTSDAPGGAY
jgi:hypothetical protein